jgi:ABC-type glycerol-3-phosphate transport system substrate-binding protein
MEEAMKIFRLLLVAMLGAGFTATAAAQTTLRIFTGGQQRPDVMRKVADEYTKRNPSVKIEIEVGGATSEAQQQYLNTVLAARDSALDLMLIDVIRPAQWAAAGWAEPFDAYLGADKAKLLPTYLKAYADADQVNGKLIALPFFADAQFLYYRKDLLDKYKRPVPKTWDELMETAQIVMKGENNPQLQGFSTAGAPIEGTVCTYLVPLWGAGGELIKNGKPNLDTPEARKPFELMGRLKVAGVLPKNIGEIATDRVRVDFQAGNVIFAQNWGYFWNRVENDADTKVKGKVGVDAARRQRRPERIVHRRLAGRGLGLLEEQAGGGEVRALPVVARGVENHGDPRVQPTGVSAGVQGSRSAQGEPVVRGRTSCHRGCEVAAGDATVHRSIRRDSFQHERISRGHEDDRYGAQRHEESPGADLSLTVRVLMDSSLAPERGRGLG